jgi:hypothetical protein
VGPRAVLEYGIDHLSQLFTHVLFEDCFNDSALKSVTVVHSVHRSFS